MNITLHLDGSEGERELAALAALIASLRGERTDGLINTYGDYDRPPQPPVSNEHIAPGAAPFSSDDLMREEAARAAGRPTGSPSTGEESPAGGLSNPEGAPDRDADGLPWDARIHSSNKATNADGTWRKRRGVDEIMHGRIVAELQAADEAKGGYTQRMTEEFSAEQEKIEQAVSAAIAPPPPPAADVPNAPPPPPSGPAPAPAATESAGAAATTAVDPMANYRAMMTRVSSSRQPYAVLDEQARMLGLAKFTDLVRNLDRVDEYVAHLEAMGLLAPVAG